MSKWEGPSGSDVSTENSAPLEVEQKYRVASHEPIFNRLQAFQASELPAETQCDIYLRHPSRDFAVTGEAFRIRKTNDSSVVTYKGARLPGEIKTRLESEIALAPNTSDQWLQILTSLGFREAARVRKQRRSYTFVFQSTTFTIALDTVESLGMFVEIEAIVTDRSTLPRIHSLIVDLAKQLELEQVESRSYLRQLLEQDS